MNGQTNDNDYGSYNADDLRRYLAGQMTTAEMHALEQASMADPFLGDALEGMRQVQPDVRDDIALLRRRMAERNAETKRVIPLWRRPARIAAAVLLLIGLGGLGYFFAMKSAAPKDIAVSTEQTKAPVAGPETPAAAPEEPAASGNTASAARQKPAKAARTVTLPGKDDLQPGTAPAASAAPGRAKLPPEKTATTPEAERVKKDRRLPAPRADKEREAADKTGGFTAAPVARPEPETITDPAQRDVAASVDASGILKEKKEAPAAVEEKLEGRAAGIAVRPAPNRKPETLAFSGQVLDNKGQAVAGAAVRMGKAITTTDIQGKFRVFAVPASDSSHLDFNAVGYQAVTLIPDARHGDDLSVILTPAATALNDVVVSGYGSPKKSSSSDTTPAPAPGWKRYRNYLGANKIQPSIDSSLHGTEKITFSISPEGEPQDFVVDHSLSAAHDSVAIRIIRNGPKWKPARNTTRRMSLALPY